ncbi:hypothetical protein N0V93_005257 [Gnomoniopsis smithogilvyi]|uniref:Uncharacterized protein n=1 Tax=Gnomoniopsis smithogilvyi TaxID=1191159 RepID=A0A9W9CWY9_9PEZI|nr:hypothetical protein N0V93_005257 [Gnomoniopsis smithogilvyi]
MASSSLESTAPEDSDTDSKDYKVNVNTPVVVAWEGQHTKLDLHFQHDRLTSTAFLKLRATLVLKALSPAKSYLYLFVPPERIQSLTLDESPDPDSIPSNTSKALGSSFTCLRVSLSTTADLIGPRSVNLKPKNQAEGRVLDDLRSLVRSTAFSIFIPHHVLPKARLLCACYGINDRLLRSDPGQLDLACLYEGKGGMKATIGGSDNQSRIAPGNLPQPSGDSPPSYSESGPCPPAIAGPSVLPASKKRRLESSGPVELGDDLLAAMRKMIQEEVRIQVSHEVQKLETRLTDKLDRIVERHTKGWSEELEGTRQEFDDKIEDDFFGVRMKLEDYIKEELTEAEERIVQHLQNTASVHLEFGS